MAKGRGLGAERKGWRVNEVQISSWYMAAGMGRMA